jgi:hypothetical protein
MWNQEFDVVCDTLRSNKYILKMIVERDAYLAEINLLKRPEHSCAEAWRERSEACPKTIALLETIIDNLPDPTPNPTDKQVHILKHLVAGTPMCPLECAYNLPARNIEEDIRLGELATRMLGAIGRA